MKPDPIEVLRKLEWGGFDSATCLICDRHVAWGHAPGCEMAACFALPQSEEPAVTASDVEEELDLWDGIPCQCGATAHINTWFRSDSAEVGRFECEACGRKGAVDFPTDLPDMAKKFTAVAAPAPPVPASADRVRVTNEMVERFQAMFDHCQKNYEQSSSEDVRAALEAALSAAPEEGRVSNEVVVKLARQAMEWDDPMLDGFITKLEAEDGSAYQLERWLIAKLGVRAGLSAVCGFAPRAATDHDGGAE